MTPTVLLRTSILLICLGLSHQLPFIPPNLKPQLGDALEAIFGMGVRLETLLHNQKEGEADNFLVSPLSAAMVIGQLMLGAEGEFQDHLYNLLSLPEKLDNKNVLRTHMTDGTNTTTVLPYAKLHLQLASLVRELKRSTGSYKLETTNALFVSEGLTMNDTFLHETTLLYETDIRKINFEKPQTAMDFINTWASQHTNGLIPAILHSPPSPATAGIFANSVYFKGEWDQPFSNELNTVGPFYRSPEKTTNVTFMTGLLESIPFYHSKKLDCKMVVLPYKNRELGMYIVLPNKSNKYAYDINEFANTVKIPDFLEMIENLKDRDVVVKIPKLSLSSSVSLLEPLEKYAVYKKKSKQTPSTKTNVLNVLKDKIEDFKVYNTKSKQAPSTKTNVLDVLKDNIEDFKGFNTTEIGDIILTAAATKPPLIVSGILQQMTFAINEKGTEAAAITAGIIDYNGGSKTFLANKPFMFFIRHEATAATLFWGTISNPMA